MPQHCTDREKGTAKVVPSMRHLWRTADTTCPPARRPASASARSVTTLLVRHLRQVGAALSESWLYFSGSNHSRWWQLETLRELDDRLLRDIGVTRPEAMRGCRNEDTCYRHDLGP